MSSLVLIRGRSNSARQRIRHETRAATGLTQALRKLTQEPSYPEHKTVHRSSPPTKARRGKPTDVTGCRRTLPSGANRRPQTTLRYAAAAPPFQSAASKTAQMADQQLLWLIEVQVWPIVTGAACMWPRLAAHAFARADAGIWRKRSKTWTTFLHYSVPVLIRVLEYLGKSCKGTKRTCTFHMKRLELEPLLWCSFDLWSPRVLSFSLIQFILPYCLNVPKDTQIFIQQCQKELLGWADWEDWEQLLGSYWSVRGNQGARRRPARAQGEPGPNANSSRYDDLPE